MHRIEMAVDMIVETLRCHGNEVDGLEPELRAEAEALAQQLRDEGLTPDQAVRRAHDLLPAQVLPRYDIHPIREGLWLRVFFLSTLALLAGLDLVWLGRGQDLLASIGVLTLILVAVLAVLKWLEQRTQARIGDTIMDGVFRYNLRRTRIDDIRGLYWSRWLGVRFILVDGGKRSIMEIDPRNYYFWKRLLLELKDKVEIPAKIAKRFDRLSSPRRAWLVRTALLMLNFAAIGLLMLVMALHLTSDQYFPLLLALVISFVGLFNLWLLRFFSFRLQLIFSRQPYLLGAVPWIFGFLIMMLFHDRVYFLSLLVLTASAYLAIIARVWAPPCPSKNYFKAAGAIMALSLLGPLAAGFTTPSNVQTIAIIGNAAFTHQIVNVRDQDLVAIISPPFHRNEPKLYLVDLNTGEVKPFPMEIQSDGAYCSLSPDKNHMICSDWTEKPGSYRIWISSTESLAFSEIKSESGANFGYLNDYLSDVWSPDGEGVILRGEFGGHNT